MKVSAVSSVVVAIVAASTALASSTAPSVASVKGGTYKVESYHTQVGFSLSHFGFTHYSGLFSGATGSLRLDPANPATSKLDVTIPVQSIQTTVPVLTEELKGDKWFDAAKFPQATFTSTKVEFSPKGEGTITGNLTLHGVTKPIVLHAHLLGAGVNPINKAYTVGFDASGTIKRSDFGVSMYAPALGDEVQLSIAGAFELSRADAMAPVPMSDGSRERYTAGAIALHWVMALGILALAAIGLVMVHVKLPLHRKFELYQLHKSIGVTVLLAAFLRLGWRLTHRPPELPAHMPQFERLAAHGGHLMLYFFLFALPLTGWALVSASPLNLPTHLYGLIPWPHLPVLSTLRDKAPVAAVLKVIHRYGAWTLLALVAGHAGAALRHHFIKRDGVLLRMIPHLRRDDVH